MKPRTLILVIVALATSLIIFIAFVFVEKTSQNFSVLHAEYTVETADIGIPGVTKMYDARLVNSGRAPVRVEICAYIDDAGGGGGGPVLFVANHDGERGTLGSIRVRPDAKTRTPSSPRLWEAG